MKKSAFQFTTPKLTSIVYDENSSTPMSENLDFNCQSTVNVKKVDEHHAVVKLSLVIGDKNENPFFICAQMEANFKWDDSFPNDMIDKMLQNNAASLLLSYLRPIIANITNSTRFHTINIPFMDFRDSVEEDENKNN